MSPEGRAIPEVAWSPRKFTVEDVQKNIGRLCLFYVYDDIRVGVTSTSTCHPRMDTAWVVPKHHPCEYVRHANIIALESAQTWPHFYLPPGL